MKRFCLLLLSLFYIAQGLAKPIPLLTLQEAVFLALRYNINIQNSELDRTVQKFDLALAYHEFEPQFFLTGSTAYNETKTNGVKGYSESYNLTPSAKLKTALGTDVSLIMHNNYDGTVYGQGAGLDITQPLLRGFGPDIAQYNLLNAIDQEKINKLQLKNMVTTQIQSVISGYRQLLLDYNNLRINKIFLQDSIARTKKSEVEEKIGRISGLDLLQIKSSIPQQQLSVSQAENQLVRDKNTLLDLIGLQPDFEFNIPQNIEVKTIKPPSFNECVQIALKNNTSYQIAALNIKTAERALHKAQDEARWKLDLKANLNSGTAGAGSTSNLFDRDNYGKTIGLNLEVPLDTLAIKRNIASNKIALQKSRIALVQRQREIELEVANKLFNLKAQEQQIQLAIIARDNTAKLLAAEQKKLQYGRASAFQLNSYQNNLITDEQRVVQSQINYLNALIDLQTLLGTLLDEWKIEIRY
jgi:outer membrane protein TolC